MNFRVRGIPRLGDAGYKLVDQVVSSGTNLVLHLLLLLGVSTAEFGRISLVILVLVSSTTFSRFVIGDALLATVAAEDLEQPGGQSRPRLTSDRAVAHQSATVVLGLGFGLLAGVVAAIFAPFFIGVALVVTTVATPIVEGARYRSFLWDGGRTALRLDGLWAVMGVVAVVVSVTAGVAAGVLLWASGAVLAAIWGWQPLRGNPLSAGVLDAWGWLGAQARLLGYEGVVSQGALQLATATLAVPLTAHEFGVLRSVQTLLLPANFVGSLIAVFVLSPTGSASSHRSLLARGRIVGFLGGSSVLAWGLVVTVLLASGNTPGTIDSDLAYLGAVLAAGRGAAIWSTALGSVARALRRGLQVLRIELLAAVVVLTVPLAAWQAGVAGAGLGLASRSVLSALLVTVVASRPVGGDRRRPVPPS